MPNKEAASEAVSLRPKTILFLHIPKTAGTSFLLTLQNAFGDNHVKRIRDASEGIDGTIAAIIENRLSSVSCLTGHLPLWHFNERLSHFQPFTVLRDPVSRVLSLYRFLKERDASNLNRLGISPDIKLDEFLESRHPEIFSQVNDGMVRMLCGDRRLENANTRELGLIGTVALRQSFAGLEKIDFGLAEDMPSTLLLAQSRWSVPYELREYRENTTIDDESTTDISSIHKIIQMNVQDQALYRRASSLFKERVRSIPRRDPLNPWNALAVFHPSVNKDISIGNVSGRQGFHEFEKDGFAWLHAGQAAEINFVMPVHNLRIRLNFYAVITEYPVADISVCIDGKRLMHKSAFANDRWCWLETESFETTNTLHRLEIEAPLFIQAVAVQNQTKDRRCLGIALANIRFKVL